MNLVSKVQRIIAIERKRYSKKGLKNIIIGLVVMLSLIQIGITIGKQYWPDEIKEDEKFQFIFIGSVFFHMFFQLVSLLIYLPGYMGWSQYYKSYQINKKLSKPWERKDWPEMRSKVIKNLLLNQLIVYPLTVCLSKVSGIRLRFQDFPGFFEVLSQVLIVYFIEDFFFYWAHRFFHLYPTLYKMHKVHHQFDSLFTGVTEYFHPLDFCIANVLPSAMGFIILGSRVHCFTFFYWICWKILISTQGHSGYEFLWSPMRVIPFVSGPSYHDHHHSNNVGNFSGSCYLWDVLLDTNQQYMDDFLKSS